MASVSAPYLLLFALFFGLSFAQRADGQYWPCNPIQNASCPPNPGLAQSTYSIDFTTLKTQDPNWTISNDNVVTYGTNGAQFTFAKRYDAPQLWTNFYILFGRVDVMMKVAPGQGIISSSVLMSDDFDEIDWEWSGNNFGFSDSAGMVQNNYFGKGITGTYDRGLFVNISSPQTLWHTYSVDWSPTQLVWLIDGQPVRTLLAADCKDNEHQFPQTPSKLQIGLWDGGDASENSGTMSWAGGLTDLTKAPFTMYVRSVKITNTNPAYAYNYTDHSGSWQSIHKIQDPNWNSASSSGIQSTTSISSSPILKPVGGTASNTLTSVTSATGSGSSVPSVIPTSSSAGASQAIGSTAPSTTGSGTSGIPSTSTSCTSSVPATSTMSSTKTSTASSTLSTPQTSTVGPSTTGSQASQPSTTSTCTSTPTSGSAASSYSTAASASLSSIISALPSVASSHAASSLAPSGTTAAVQPLCTQSTVYPYFGGGFLGFELLCNIDYPGSDIKSFPCNDMATCVNSCNTYRGSQSCDATAFLPDTKVCYLKDFSRGVPRAVMEPYKTHSAVHCSYAGKAGRWRKRSWHLRRHARNNIHK